MKTLNLTFKGSLGKKHLLKLAYAKQDLSEAVVRQAMQEIAQSHMFNSKDEDIYAEPLSAKYVDTVFTVIFNDNKKDEAAA